jgi:hypothetical protein
MEEAQHWSMYAATFGSTINLTWLSRVLSCTRGNMTFDGLQLNCARVARCGALPSHPEVCGS